MQNYKIKNILLFTILTLFSNCANYQKQSHISPINNKSWTIELKNSSNSFSEKKVYNEVYKELQNKIPKQDKIHLKKMIEKEVSQSNFIDKSDKYLICKFALNNAAKKIRERLDGFADYELKKFNVLVPDKDRYNFTSGYRYKFHNSDVYSKNNNYQFDVNYSATWNWRTYRNENKLIYYRKADANLVINIDNNCSDFNLANQKITITLPQYSIGTPMSGLLHNPVLANIVIDWNLIESNLDKINFIDYDPNQKLISNIVSNIEDTFLVKRYDVRRNSNDYSKELTINTSFDIALSRLQRKLDNVTKYDKENSRFLFKKKYCAQKNKCADIEVEAKLFPEANNKSALVVKMQYDKIYDNVTSKYIFDKAAAIRFLNKNYINELKSILNK